MISVPAALYHGQGEGSPGHAWQDFNQNLGYFDELSWFLSVYALL